MTLEILYTENYKQRFKLLEVIDRNLYDTFLRHIINKLHNEIMIVSFCHGWK